MLGLKLIHVSKSGPWWTRVLNLRRQIWYVDNNRECKCICNVQVIIRSYITDGSTVMHLCVSYSSSQSYIFVRVVAHSSVDLPIQYFTECTCINLMEAILNDVIVGGTLNPHQALFYCILSSWLKEITRPDRTLFDADKRLADLHH